MAPPGLALISETATQNLVQAINRSTSRVFNRFESAHRQGNSERLLSLDDSRFPHVVYSALINLVREMVLRT